MTKKNSKVWSVSTILLAFSYITPLKAQTCEMPPSCEVLGYTKTAEDCANKVTLKCPLDESKLYCADAKQNGVCSSGYSEIEKIIPYCTGSNARLIYDTKNPNCAKCQKCGAGAHLNKISGCCPDDTYASDGCAGYQTFNIQDSNGCWTCSRCRSPYTLNAQGLCVDPSVITGGTCPAGYATYAEIIPYCEESEKVKMVQHSSSKGCYQCKRCSSGYYFNNKCGLGASSDGNGCTRCDDNCALGSVDYRPVDGWCR